MFIAEVFSRREIPLCDAHYLKRQCGLVRELEGAVPLTEVECVRDIKKIDGSGSGAQVFTPHNITVTQVTVPGVNELRSSQVTSSGNRRL